MYEFLAESIQAFEEEKRDERTQRMRESIVMNIKTSPAIQPLVPLYLRYIIKEISQSQSPTKIVSLPQLAMTLLSNKLLNLEPYLSHFTSIALTLLLTPPPKNYEQRIYEMGTSFLKSIIHRFQENYKDYHLKIAESLATYLFTDGHPLSTKYGAVLGLEALGHEVIQTYLLPNLPQFFDEFKLYLTDEQASNRKQAIKLKNLLYRVCTIAFHIITGEHDPTSSPSLDPSTAALFREIASFFGYSDFYLFAAAK
ncbi:hypothetical protein TRFO_06834 [Tritrichomonas foetus]|uniref:TAF6 C-terminal HEAT repeat domain-containing protein n=1 Tax=Tritrichomonas foetus TaxID=1144522 RepID=A0A1J4JVH5_9EUKA|nr:hypothetical protein TRFO_06834 [Tritrichomonas foetus]|eukprot:OHT03159.1 hypothetical protein TRFO_06834 [Tritrichomonas foetus]